MLLQNVISHFISEYPKHLNVRTLPKCRPQLLTWSKTTKCQRKVLVEWKCEVNNKIAIAQFTNQQKYLMTQSLKANKEKQGCSISTT